MGVREEVMGKVVEKEGATTTVKELLKEYLGMEEIEATRQTQYLEKWLLLCNQDKHKSTFEK